MTFGKKIPAEAPQEKKRQQKATNVEHPANNMTSLPMNWRLPSSCTVFSLPTGYSHHISPLQNVAQEKGGEYTSTINLFVLHLDAKEIS